MSLKIKITTYRLKTCAKKLAQVVENQIITLMMIIVLFKIYLLLKPERVKVTPAQVKATIGCYLKTCAIVLAQKSAQMVENEVTLLVAIVFFAMYFLWNTACPKPLQFDPYPYPLLCMSVSVIAIWLLLALGVANKNKK
jgi:hypothetical protein